jgi:predicted AlkP superfamily pyrophosphatase or phosphodiesterase
MKSSRLLSLLLPVSLMLGALVSLFFFNHCSSTQDTPPQWLFLITLDTTRADHIDYSLNNSTTPNLAKLASEGQYFSNAYSLIPITLPSHASMFYSLPPHRLKIYNNGQVQKIREPSVTQLLKGNRYTTGAVISLGVLKGDFGLNKGFDSYIENFKPSLWNKDAAQVNEETFRLLDQVQKNNNEFFFGWFHYSDPHEPYFPPQKDQSTDKTNVAATGKFHVVLDETHLFTSSSSDQPGVHLTFDLPPGTHRLVFNTDIPIEFKQVPGAPCKVEYVKFRDFVLSPAGPLMKLPANWTHRETGTGTNYYSNLLQSEITLVNNSKVQLAMTLKFFYSLQVDDISRKAFYREEVKYLDSRLGQLMDYLKQKGIYKNATFIIIGDHGETLGDYRNHFGHIHYLDSSAMKVPLILAGKGIQPKGKREELVSTLNIAPTLLDLANIKKPVFMQGQSLLGPISQTKLLLETYSPEAYFDAFSIIDYPYQIAFYPGRRSDKLEFYNLKDNTSGEHARRAPGAEKARTELINSVLKISRIITATKGKIGKASKRHQEILKSLGYL